MTNSTITLKAALGGFPHVAALRDGRVAIPGVEFEHTETREQVDIWRRMIQHLEFDISLMSVITYLCAIEYDVPITCLPISLSAGFHHGDFLINKNAGIRTPHDLAGKKVGTRTWTVTPGTLDRGILVDEFGMDWRSITWVLAEPEHLPQAQGRLPSNVITSMTGNLFPRLAAGEIDAGIAGVNLQRQEDPNVVPLFPNATELDRAYYQKTGIIQPFVLVAMKNSAIEAHPGLMEELYVAFKQAKALTPAEALPNLKEVIGDADPLPYGLAANRAGCEEAIRLAREFDVITKPMSPESIFPHLD